jgi:hypothetical protein
MLEVTDFFQKKAQECRSLAAAATQKKDREFWQALAQRWDGLLQPGGPPDEADKGHRFDRPIGRFAKPIRKATNSDRRAAQA